MSQLCSNRLSHCLHTFDMVLIVTPPSAVIFGVPSICAFPVLLVQSLACKPPAHLDIALEWKSFPACHISHHQPQFPTHQKPCAPTRYHSCIFLNSLLIRGGQAKTKYNNWCWAVARAVRNAEVLLYGTTVKEKLLKTVFTPYTAWQRHRRGESVSGYTVRTFWLSKCCGVRFDLLLIKDS